VFDKPGVVVVGCNIHDWMLAYIVVLETPWFAKVCLDGNRDHRRRAARPLPRRSLASHSEKKRGPRNCRRRRVAPSPLRSQPNRSPASPADPPRWVAVINNARAMGVPRFRFRRFSTRLLVLLLGLLSRPGDDVFFVTAPTLSNALGHSEANPRDRRRHLRRDHQQRIETLGAMRG